MSIRKRAAVLSILVALLIAAAINLYLIFHASVNGPMTLSGHAADKIGPESQAGTSDSTIPVSKAPLLNWYGDVSLAKSKPDNGAYDVVVTAAQQGKPVEVEHVEADLHGPDGATAGVTLAFTKQADGTYLAHVAFPKADNWEVRVRIHRKTETLEFARVFKVDGTKK